LNLWEYAFTRKFKLMSKIVNVGIGQFKVARAPMVLITHNLGSCVGIALYEIYHKIGGLAHITLPSYKDIDYLQEKNPKFADTALPLMIEKMKEMGANLTFMVAKVAGGGDMFGLSPNAPLELDIGKQNVEAVRRCLEEYGIKVVAEEVLGTIPRTMELELNTGKVTLRTAQRKTRFL